MINFIFGMIVGSFIFEFFIINFVYMSNIALFNDLILTKKNSKNLRDYYEKSN